MYKSVLNESEFVRARKHFDIIQWYSFWYQWVKEVHDLHEIYMVGVETTLRPFWRTCYKKKRKENKTKQNKTKTKNKKQKNKTKQKKKKTGRGFSRMR